MRMHRASREALEASFRDLCHRNQLAVTHQRSVIYRALMEMPGHPSPEEIFARVRREVPSMSLATVYKTLHSFLHAGIVQEVSPHRGSLRIDPNLNAHHHLVCTNCRSITDIDDDAVGPIALRGRLPRGFRVERYALEIHGLCERCAAQTGGAAANAPRRGRHSSGAGSRHAPTH